MDEDTITTYKQVKRFSEILCNLIAVATSLICLFCAYSCIWLNNSVVVFAICFAVCIIDMLYIYKLPRLLYKVCRCGCICKRKTDFCVGCGQPVSYKGRRIYKQRNGGIKK